MKFDILNINNPRWSKLIKACKIYDFHHTPCYHALEKKEKESPLLFVAESTQENICLPLIIKKIPKTQLYDATSVYGYAGPIANKPIDQLSKNLIIFFKKNLLDFFIENNIISVFSRLHPIFKQSNLFEKFGTVIDLNKTIALDLTLSPQEQRKDYRKSNKSEINQLKKKKGYTVTEATKEFQIEEFVSIYHENMSRVNAKDYYFFNLKYFKSLLNNPCFNCKLLVAIKDDKITAGAIFTITKSIMQYHLAGTREEYFRDTPMKLILDEARLIGNEMGLQYLHLGGGVGGSDEDSLFRFKSGFSKNFFQFSVWNLIVDKEEYDKLVLERKVKKEDYPNFFPLYRAN